MDDYFSLNNRQLLSLRQRERKNHQAENAGQNELSESFFGVQKAR